MNVRQLAPDDAPAYRALMLDAYTDHPEAFTSSAKERGALPLAWWEARLDPASTAVTIVTGAFDQDRLVGAAGLEFETREKARHKSTLFGMVVMESCRGRGIGRLLIESSLAYAKTRPSVLLMQLTVTEGNRAAEILYARCGFVVFGVEPAAIAVGTSFVAKTHMWRYLHRALPQSGPE